MVQVPSHAEVEGESDHHCPAWAPSLQEDSLSVQVEAGACVQTPVLEAFAEEGPEALY